MFRNYLLSALRTIQKSKLYAAINVFGLAAGLSCAMLIVLYVKDDLSFDRFHRNADNIYRVDRQMVRPNGNIDNSGVTGYLQGPRFAAHVPGIRAFVRFKQSYRDFRTERGVRSQAVSFADSNFFREFSFPLIEGDPKLVLSEPHSVVLTETTARQYFGKVEAMGKSLLIKEGETFMPYRITGIAKDCPENSSISFNILMPLRSNESKVDAAEGWFDFSLATFLVLEPGADLRTIESGMHRFFLADAAETIRELKKKYGINHLGLTYFLQPLTDIHLSTKLPSNEGLSAGGNPNSDYILSAIALFVLLIACINFVNLTVARSIKRAREIGIRKVIGGTRRELILQFFGESSMLCLFAFILATVLVRLILPYFNSLADKNLSFSYLLDTKLVIEYVCLYLGTSLMAGSYPALILSRYDPVKTLYGRFDTGGKNYLQKSLLLLQFTLACFLAVGTVTVFLQFRFLTSQSLGYDDKNLVQIGKPEITSTEFQLFRSELMKDPDIRAVQVWSGGYMGNTVKVNDGQELNMLLYNIDTGYLSMLSVPVVRGRNLSADLPTDSSRSILVNETFVKQAGWQDPLGKKITFVGKPPLTVVGVVKDYHFKPMTERIEPELFSMNRENYYGSFLVKIRAGTEASALRLMTRTYNRLFPMNSFSFTFKSEENARAYEAEERWKNILLFGAVLTIFLSCMGLFGLAVLSAEKRVKEIGIRKVLGASVGNVIGILSIDFLKLVVIALIVAFPLAGLAASKWLQNYPYRIAPGWGLFALVALGLMAISMLTIGFQAAKAALANPAKSLRAD